MRQAFEPGLVNESFNMTQLKPGKYHSFSHAVFIESSSIASVFIPFFENEIKLDNNNRPEVRKSLYRKSSH